MKSLETFEFRAIPSLNKSLVLELARSAYLWGGRGTSAHTGERTCWRWATPARARRIWRWRWGWPRWRACQKGYRVRFTTAAALVNDRLTTNLLRRYGREARDDKRLLRVQKQLVKQD